MTVARPWLPFGLVALFGAWSFVAPADRGTWWLESLPALIGLPLVLWLWPRFPWTPLAVTLMALHAAVLLMGARYTYAETPFGYWMQDVLGTERNPYDRLGHLMQGFAPALLAREVLSRRLKLRGAWLTFLVTCFCLALSSSYELIEWLVAVALGQGADAFLGTQGDPWDTQWDMFTCFIGAVLSLTLLGRWHNQQLARLTGRAF
ncbi:DUF2238 domain-containing protein [Crenobacter cavernae]|uniref:DUF2238 domain-containing protein n=1 Tax=Crenobacter cavernae TaxID=2290923 RepID=A0A345Y348_9NEIS|nr:DUF2238 domain-containing protein [Crenobacter cavernae]AXK38350.1 DUF2238 domain-containing protein [Crenobacter cavernae]